MEKVIINAVSNPTEVAQLRSLNQEACRSGPLNHFCFFIDCISNAFFLTNESVFVDFKSGTSLGTITRLLLFLIYNIVQYNLLSFFGLIEKKVNSILYINDHLTENLKLGQIRSKNKKWFYVTKIVLTYCEKRLFYW